MLGFLVSLHDIGKYSRPFQAMARECWPVNALGSYPRTNPPPGPRHDVVGLHFLSDIFSDRLEDLLPIGLGRAGLETPRPDALVAGTSRASRSSSVGDQCALRADEGGREAPPPSRL